MIARAARAGSLLALAPLLGGCVAAAVPLLAGGLVAREQATPPERQTPAAPPEERVAVFSTTPIFTTGIASNSVSAAPVSAVAVPGPGRPAPAPAPIGETNLAVTNTPATAATTAAAPALAVPVAAAPLAAIGAAPPGSPDSWAAFARYAVTRAPPPPPGQVRRSAVIDQATLTAEPKPQSCGRQPPAVVIDLDPGEGPIDLDDPPSPAPGLTDALAGMRNVGVTVLWLTAHPLSAEDRIRRMLRAVELDEGGVDKLLLLREAGERKQTRKIAALRDWCIIAVAGDRRSDFDELFDYLIDARGPTATALEPLFGDGWFLSPPPVG